MLRLALVLICTSLVSSEVVRAADWPAFRGPRGDGFSDEKNLPTEWSQDKNVKWKVALPHPGNSSPVVTGNRVFITIGNEDGTQRGLYCYNRADGSLLWSKVVAFDRVLPTHKTNPYGAPTPATDGKSVVVWHGSAGLFCYDLDGKEIWHRDLGEFKHEWGYAASPVIHQDRVYQNCAPGEAPFFGAFDLATGRDLWRVPEPNRERSGYKGSWSTPLVTKLNGVEQILCFQPSRVVSYAPNDGKIIWEYKLESGKGDLAYSSPMLGKGLCVAINGFSGLATGFKLDGSGDLTGKNKLWDVPRNPQSIGTGVIIGDHVYIPDAGPSTIRCLEAATGKEVWAERMGSYWGSIVMAGELAYVTSQSGETVVFRPNPEKFDLVAKNNLGEHCNATPALSDGQIFIRTYENLYCIGAK